MAVTLRRATAADADVTFSWANDPATRAASFHSAAIERAEHERWLQGSLAGERRVLFIAESAGLPVAVLRLDPLSPRSAEIGITVAPEHRGQGLSLRVLEAGIREARLLGSTCLVARIRADNARSLRSFRRAGFQPVGTELVNGQLALRYELRLPHEP